MVLSEMYNFEMTPKVSVYFVSHTICLGLQLKEPQTAYPISITKVPLIADGMINSTQSINQSEKKTIYRLSRILNFHCSYAYSVLQEVCSYLLDESVSDEKLVENIGQGLNVYCNTSGTAQCFNTSQQGRKSLGDQGWGFQVSHNTISLISCLI